MKIEEIRRILFSREYTKQDLEFFKREIEKIIQNNIIDEYRLGIGYNIFIRDTELMGMCNITLEHIEQIEDDL